MAERVERRLRQIQAELDTDRLVTGRQDELNNLSMDLRNVFNIYFSKLHTKNIYEPFSVKTRLNDIGIKI